MKTSLAFLVAAFLCVFFPFEGQNQNSGKNTPQVNNTPVDSTPRDGVYDKMAITQQEPIPYPYLREADIVWTKRVWRMVDLREKINQPFYFPDKPRKDYRSFAQLIWDNVMDHTISGVYNADKNDRFTVPITLQEILDRVESVDSTLVTTDSAGTDIKTWNVTHNTFTPVDVKKFLIKEDWYFDRQRSVFEVRILGICPITMNRVKGMNVGDKWLFWIYFPDCRKVFSQYEVFNLKNGVAGRMTYDDVFMKRMFSSYVVKEENVYDREIGDYAKGVDALLESEKAKNTLYEFEQNLWEY